MAKEQDVPQYVQDFMDAVYEGRGALALASFNEEAALRDATKRIKALEKVVRIARYLNEDWDSLCEHERLDMALAALDREGDDG